MHRLRSISQLQAFVIALAIVTTIFLITTTIFRNNEETETATFSRRSYDFAMKKDRVLERKTLQEKAKLIHNLSLKLESELKNVSKILCIILSRPNSIDGTVIVEKLIF